jgi:hypothetical protein
MAAKQPQQLNWRTSIVDSMKLVGMENSPAERKELADLLDRCDRETQERSVQMAKGRRTTHRSVAGKKLYAVRDAKGRFKDIQTYERAHRADLKQKGAKER